MKNDNALFFTCSLIEAIGRTAKLRRGEVVEYLSEDVHRIYTHADVFHCEPIEKVAWDFIDRRQIPMGCYDVEARAKYRLPDCWDIGEVFERLVEDCYSEGKEVQGIREVFASWLAEAILNFNSDLFYQPREYLAACYREGKVLVA